MRIVIDYDSCWQTSFLGDDDKKPILQKEGSNNKKKTRNHHATDGYMQKFVATSGTRGEEPAPITDSTVMGVLCRLIGDQRKLYQSRQSDGFYFRDIEDSISWRIVNDLTVNELLYLTNKSDDRTGQSTWLGVLPDECPWFFSENAHLLWSVLYLNRDEILDFIMSNAAHTPAQEKEIDCRPTALLARLDKITDVKSILGEPWKISEKIKKDINENYQKELKKKEKYIENNENKPQKTKQQHSAYIEKLKAFDLEILKLEKKLVSVESDQENLKLDQKLKQCISHLEQQFPNCSFWSDGELYPQRIYTSALYEQANRLIDSGISLDFAIESSRKNKGEVVIKGFAKDSRPYRGFNGVRDWLNPMSGGRKKAVGTPCQVQKQSGQLEIKLDIDINRAIELKTMIDNAGVSAFYLGKKGLAYVSHIDVR